MRVAVTGAGGFAGRFLSPALAAAGHEVIGWVRVNSATKRRMVADLPGLTAWDYCDLARRDVWTGLWRRWQPDAVIHLAAQSSGARAFRDPAATFAANATGTLHLLDAAARAVADGLRPPRLLLVGTSEIYAIPSSPTSLTEDAPLGPRSPYGASKAAADMLGSQYALSHGLPVIRTRSFAHTGPGQETVFALSSFAEQIARAEARGEPAEVQTGNLSVVRDYCDVRDVVRAYVMLLEHGVAGEAYNVCSGKGHSMAELLALLTAEARVPVRVVESSERLRPGDVASLIGDPSKLERTTGWRREHSLASCLRDMLNEWRHVVASGAGPTRAWGAT